MENHVKSSEADNKKRQINKNKQIKKGSGEKKIEITNPKFVKKLKPKHHQNANAKDDKLFKKGILHKYNKDGPKSSFPKKLGEQQSKPKRVNQLQLLAERRKKEKEANEQFIKEKQEKRLKYKKTRLEKTKAISKKTQKGQPLMKSRIEMLLKQITESKN